MTASLDEKVSRGGNWTDLRVPVSSTNKGGSKDPDFLQIQDDGAGSQGLFTYQFSPNTEEELYFVTQMPHGWVAGTNIDCHVHWGPTSANIGGVVWGVEYSIASAGEQLGPSTIIKNTDTTDGTFPQNRYFDIQAIDMTGVDLSALIVCRVFRDATNVLDTYPDDAALFEIDFHYQQDALGSTTELVK